MKRAHGAQVTRMIAKAAKERAWRETPAGFDKYLAARAEAQAKANELGFDFGLEANDIFRSYTTYMLPAKTNRRGHELQCEVVMCEKLDKCQPGHGPMASS